MVNVVQAPAPGSGFSATFSALGAGSSLYLGAVAFAFANDAITSSAPQLGGSPFAGAVLLDSVLSDYNGSGVVYVAFWELPDVPGGETTASLSVGGGGTALNLFPIEVAGLGASPVLDQVASAHHPDASNPSSGPTGNTTAAPELALGIAAILGVGMTAPAGWTAQPGASDFCWSGYQVLASSGQSVTYAQNSASPNTWAALALTIAGTSAPPSSYQPISQGSRKVIAVPADSIIQGSHHVGQGAS